MSARVLVIGLDGADGLLIDEWVDSGRLPTLARLRSEGTRGDLTPLPALSDDAVWATFSTGVPPGHHGRYYHLQIGDDGQTLSNHKRGQMTYPPFWDALDRAGKRVCVLDVPKSPIGIGGSAVVADWMCHGQDGPVLIVNPGAAAFDVLRGIAVDPGFTCEREASATVASTKAFEQRLFDRAALRTDVTRELLEAEDWDVVVTVFAETHCVGHRCWRDHDPSHFEHDPDRVAELGDVIEHVYADVDARIAELIETAGEDATVIVFAPLGMGPNHNGTHLIEEVLRRLESKPVTGAGVDQSISRIRRLVPHRIRRAIPKKVRATGRTAQIRARSQADFRAFTFDTRSTLVRVNRQGRDPYARLSPAEADAALLELRDELLALVDPDDGTPVVDDVLFAKDVHPGPASNDLFDIMVIWNMTRPVTGASSDRIGVIRQPPPEMRSGNHRDGGWFVAAGPGIPAGTVVSAAEIIDLAPTIAARLGVGLDDLPGQPIDAIADREQLDRAPR